MPIRIQRKRTRGWRMPENTVSVTRPGKWGNPFPVAVFGLELSLRLFRRALTRLWDPGDFEDSDRRKVAYEAWLKFGCAHHHHPLENVRGELGGKNLACFCPLDQPCHADILLEIANAR